MVVRPSTSWPLLFGSPQFTPFSVHCCAGLAHHSVTAEPRRAWRERALRSGESTVDTSPSP